MPFNEQHDAHDQRYRSEQNDDRQTKQLNACCTPLCNGSYKFVHGSNLDLMPALSANLERSGNCDPVPTISRYYPDSKGKYPKHAHETSAQSQFFQFRLTSFLAVQSGATHFSSWSMHLE